MISPSLPRRTIAAVTGAAHCRQAPAHVLRDPHWLEELYDPCEDEDADLIDEHVQRASSDEELAP